MNVVGLKEKINVKLLKEKKMQKEFLKNILIAKKKIIIISYKLNFYIYFYIYLTKLFKFIHCPIHITVISCLESDDVRLYCMNF